MALKAAAKLCCKRMYVRSESLTIAWALTCKGHGESEARPLALPARGKFFLAVLSKIFVYLFLDIYEQYIYERYWKTL